ncbi:MAG: DUF6600 domain-containing protein [Verrucomicrobiota bacterium]
MKTRISTWALGCVFALVPFAGGSVEELTNTLPDPAPIAAPAGLAASTDVAGPGTNAAPIDLANAPGKLVSAPDVSAFKGTLSGPAAEVVKLAQAGMEEGVILSVVTNSSSTFNLTSDAIIYLNDVGVPAPVISAMIARDQELRAAGAAAFAATAPPVYTNSPATGPGAFNPAPEEPAAETMIVESPQPVNTAATYFYTDLAPYGSWININGCGLCWQPAVAVCNPGWQPYCQNGRWVYSDCGWYWSSGYSWGWAPFHYGRWFRNNTWGWCWAPDTVWGPAWVNWRYTPNYCGWAPLPPTACYWPGFGFSYYGSRVSIGFGFGIGAGCYTFVPAGQFCNPHPWQCRVPPGQVAPIYNSSVVMNPVVHDVGGRHVHGGLPPSLVASASHTELRPVPIHDQSGPRGAGFGADRSIGVFRPNLPQPPSSPRGSFVGTQVQPAPVSIPQNPGTGHGPRGGNMTQPSSAGSVRPAFGRTPHQSVPAFTPTAATPRSSPVAIGQPVRHASQAPTAPVAAAVPRLNNSPVRYQSPWIGGRAESPKAFEQRSTGFVPPSPPSTPQRTVPTYQTPRVQTFQPAPAPVYQAPRSQVPSVRTFEAPVNRQAQIPSYQPAQPSFAPRQGVVQPAPTPTVPQGGGWGQQSQHSWQGGSLRSGR